jgi:geranylgeranyl diphosphate synthase, type I
VTSTPAPSAGWDTAAERLELQASLEEFVAAQGELLLPLGPDAARLVEAARGAVSGGKRLRARFCQAGFGAVREPSGSAEVTGLVRAAAALELLHASALVHDDLMDASDTRRGGPAVHRAFERRHREAGWRGDPEQYGAAAAVLLGDLLLSWADERLRTCGLPAPVVLEALRLFDATRSEVVAGQFLDVSVQARGDADVEQAMRVLRYKSAKYSVERPLQVGAALAGGTPRTLAALSAYGVPLGEAFQLRDDLLGVFGDPRVTGKPAGDDLTEGKRTVLVALALQGSPEEDARRLDEALGTPLVGVEVAELQRVIERSGAVAEVERRIEELSSTALAAVDDPAVRPGARAGLRALADAAVRRTG